MRSGVIAELCDRLRELEDFDDPREVGVEMNLPVYGPILRYDVPRIVRNPIVFEYFAFYSVNVQTQTIYVNQLSLLMGGKWVEIA